jgi:hypothetical protein
MKTKNTSRQYRDAIKIKKVIDSCTLRRHIPMCEKLIDRYDDFYRTTRNMDTSYSLWDRCNGTVNSLYDKLYEKKCELNY